MAGGNGVKNGATQAPVVAIESAESGSLVPFLPCTECADALLRLRAEIDRMRLVNEKLGEENVKLRGAHARLKAREAASGK